MISRLEKPNLLSAVICLVAALFALVAISSNCHAADQHKTEIVEVDLEDCEAITERQKRRILRIFQPRPTRLPVKQLASGSNYLAQPDFFRPTTERRFHEGFGGYLRS